MSSAVRWVREHLAPAATTLAVLLVAFAVDAYLGYREMANPSRGEQIQSVVFPDPRLGWAPRPGVTGSHRRPGDFDVRYGIDDQGLRRVPNRGVARRRIWAFGDSFTFGIGVSDADTWTSVMARDWLAPGVHVMNAGVAAYGLPQELERLEELSDRIEPGDIVLFTPISNDVDRTLEEFAYVSRFLFRRIGTTGVEGIPDLRDGRLVTARLDTPENRVLALLYNAKYTGAGIQRIAGLLWPRHPIEDAHTIVDLARGVAARRGARFQLLFLPTPEECEERRYRVDVSSFDVPDLMGAFPSDPDALARIRFPHDRHWNERGHALAARAIVGVLTREGLLAADDLAAPGPDVGPGTTRGGSVPADHAVVP